MRQVMKTFFTLTLSLSIYKSCLSSTSASVSRDEDDQIAGIAGSGSSKPSIMQPSAPPLIAQDISQTSILSSNLPADLNAQNLKDIHDLRPYFKYGSLLIKPATSATILNYAIPYKGAFKSYDGIIALKGWGEQDDLQGLLKLLYNFTALKGVKCYKNTWSEDTAVKTLGKALQFYPNLSALDLQDSALNDKQVNKLLAGKGQNNPASLTSLNIQAGSISPKMLSELKSSYPNADIAVKTSSQNVSGKAAELTVQDTTSLLAGITITEQKTPSLKPLYRPTAEEQTSVVTSVRPKTLEIKEEEKQAYEMTITIPPIAHGYEDIYKRFLKGSLIYRPQEGSDAGMIKLPIAALVNPLEGTFDLSQCGDAGKYLSIATGYRKGKKAENANKVEIWIAPRFLIEKELKTTARHFQEIYGYWSEDVPVGIFLTWGGWDDLTWYHYLTIENFDELSNNNLYKKWTSASAYNLNPYTYSAVQSMFHSHPDSLTTTISCSFYERGSSQLSIIPSTPTNSQLPITNAASQELGDKEEENPKETTLPQPTRKLTDKDIGEAINKVLENTLSIGEFAALIKSDPTLTALYFTFTAFENNDRREYSGIGDAGIIALAPSLKGLTALTTLYLSYNHISDAGITALAPSMSALTALTKLKLSNNQIGDIGISTLAPSMSALTALREFDLQRNQIGDVGIIALAPSMSALTALTTLDLSCNQIADAGISALAPFMRALTALRELCLGGNQIGDVGIITLAPSMSALTALTTLDLAFNQIGDAGIIALAPSLKALTALTKLWLFQNKIGDEGKKALEDSRCNRSSYLELHY